MTTAAQNWAIDLTNVAKTYRGKVHALRGVDMRVARGEVFGLLGPNGAGKSTLVKILMTIIRPTNAVGSVLGNRVGDKATLARIGYLPEHHRFPEYLTGAQVLDFYGGLNGVDKATRRRRIPELLELVGMKDWSDQAVKKYSKGMRQRVGIAQALIADPDLVILDEPTDGVDPVGRRDIRELLVHLKQAGKTVFLNSHLLSELEMVCDRVAIMVQGKVAMQGTIDDLTIKQRWYAIEADDPARAASIVASMPGFDWRGELGPNGFANAEKPANASIAAGRMGAQVLLWTEIATDVQGVLDALRRDGLVIKGVHARRPSLEDLFMQAVTDPTTGAALLPGAANMSGKGGRGMRNLDAAHMISSAPSQNGGAR